MLLFFPSEDYPPVALPPIRVLLLSYVRRSLFADASGHQRLSPHVRFVDGAWRTSFPFWGGFFCCFPTFHYVRIFEVEIFSPYAFPLHFRSFLSCPSSRPTKRSQYRFSSDPRRLSKDRDRVRSQARFPPLRSLLAGLQVDGARFLFGA